MQFISVQDFHIRPGEIWKMPKEQDLVVTSANGRPIAVLTDVEAEDLEETLFLLRTVRAQLAVSRMRRAARESGAFQLTNAETEAEISQTRIERK